MVIIYTEGMKMSFTEWYKEHKALDKVEFEEALENYKNDAIAGLGKSFEKNAVYLVNAGRMNHGKSSLFNSFLGREEFKAKDVRTTVKNKEVKWKDNIILVDTPGLDAVDEDTSTAYEAYYKADLIFFVHTVRIGELHDSEIQAIKKISRNFRKDYFWKHFCLVLSFKDSVDGDSLEKIKQESVNSIKRACNADDFAVFSISNSRYLKGISENKKGLINHSGILELCDYIDDKVDGWYRESVDKNKDVLKANLAKIYEEAEKLLTEEKSDNSSRENSQCNAKTVDELREIVIGLNDEIELLDKAYWKKQDKWRAISDKISRLNEKNLKISAYYDRQDESNRIEREIDKLYAQQEKIDEEQESLRREKLDKEDEAQLTCVKLGILDESKAFNYKIVMEKIDEMTKQDRSDGNKLDSIQEFCGELKKISKSDNLLLLVKNEEMSKHLRKMSASVELADDVELKKNESAILKYVQLNDCEIANKKELHDNLSNIYKKLHNHISVLESDIDKKIIELDIVISQYKQEAEKRRQEIHAVIDQDAYLARNSEILDESSRAIANGNFGKADELMRLHDRRSTEFRQLIDKRSKKMDNATKYFRKCGVLNKGEKFFNDTIDGYIDRFAENLYDDNVSELQERLRKLTNGLRSVKVIGEIVGINVEL